MRAPSITRQVDQHRERERRRLAADRSPTTERPQQSGLHQVLGIAAVARWPAIRLSVLNGHRPSQTAVVVQACVPLVAINGASYRMRAHRDAVRALRPAITGGKNRDHTREFP